MNIFGGPRNVLEDLEPVPEVKEEEIKPKTIGDIKEAKSEIQSLLKNREEKLNQHRDTVQELRDLGVNEYSPDTQPRTKTANAILNPIEEELATISEEITEKQEAFDLQPHPIKVLEDRMKRLEDLRKREEERFAKTEIGIEINALVSKINELGVEINEASRMHQSYQSQANERVELNRKKDYLFTNNKFAHEHMRTLEKIDGLRIDIDSRKRSAQSTGYDETGTMQV